MKRPSLARVLLACLLVAIPLAVASGGCANQGEGERCSLLNGNQDCGGSLVCTPASELRGGDDGVDRCCPDSERAGAVPRCRPRVGGVGAGTGGAASDPGGLGGLGGLGGNSN